MSGEHVIVIGAGVSGLTTAIAMSLAGRRVAIHAAEGPAQTTSAIAAAIWHPFYQAPDFAYLARARQTYATMCRLSSDATSGVLIRTLTEYFRHDAGVPWWAECVSGLKRLTDADLPSRFACAYRMEVPVADTATYLRYLMNMFLELGGQYVHRRVDDPALLLGAARRPGRTACTPVSQLRSWRRWLHVVVGMRERCPAVGRSHTQRRVTSGGCSGVTQSRKETRWNWTRRCLRKRASTTS